MSEPILQEVRTSVKRIETAVLGDDQAGVEGLVKRVDRHEKVLTSIQKFKWTVIGGAAVISFIFTMVKVFS